MSGFTKREWDQRFGENPETEFEDRPTYVIVKNPTSSIYWSQGELADQYFVGFRRAWSLSLEGEYEPFGPPRPTWSKQWQDAATYDSLRSAEKMLRRIVGKMAAPDAAIVGPEA